MSTEDASVQSKIIEATIECIEREGIQAVTIRKIAKLAGVNSAAINYYFRSKEKLVEEVKRSTVEHVFEDWREIINDESRTVRERLFLLFTDYMEGAIMYPGITKAHMWEPLIDNEYDSLFVKHDYDKTFGELSEDVKNRVSHRRKALDSMKAFLENLASKSTAENSV